MKWKLQRKGAMRLLCGVALSLLLSQAGAAPERWGVWQGKDIMVNTEAIKRLYAQMPGNFKPDQRAIEDSKNQQVLGTVRSLFLAQVSAEFTEEEIKGAIEVLRSNAISHELAKGVADERTSVRERLKAYERWDREAAKAKTNGSELTPEIFFQKAEEAGGAIPGFRNPDEWVQYRQQVPTTEELKSLLKSIPKEDEDQLASYALQFKTEAQLMLWAEEWLQERGIDTDILLSNENLRKIVTSQNRNPPAGFQVSEEEIQFAISAYKRDIYKTILQREAARSIDESELEILSENDKAPFLEYLDMMKNQKLPPPLPPDL